MLRTRQHSNRLLSDEGCLEREPELRAKRLPDAIDREQRLAQLGERRLVTRDQLCFELVAAPDDDAPVERLERVEADLDRRSRRAGAFA